MNETAASALSASTLQPLITALTGSVQPSDIIAILAIMVAVGMGFVLMWFGVRKLVSIFRKAVMRGRMAI